MRCNSDNVGQMDGCNVCVRHEGLTLIPSIPPTISYVWLPYERQNPCGECKSGFFGTSITENKYENTCIKCTNNPTLGAVFTNRTAEEEGLDSTCYTCKENGSGYTFESNCELPLVCDPNTGACVGKEGTCYDPCSNTVYTLPPCHICVAHPKSFFDEKPCMMVRDSCRAEWVHAMSYYVKSNFKCNEETNTCECAISACPMNRPTLMSGGWNIYESNNRDAFIDDRGCWCECSYDYGIIIKGREDPCDFLQDIHPGPGGYVYNGGICDCVYSASAASILIEDLLP